MKTIKCPQCSLVDWENAMSCKRCGFTFQSVEEFYTDKDFPRESLENRQSDDFHNELQHQPTDFENQQNQYVGGSENYQSGPEIQSYPHPFSNNQGYRQANYDQQYRTNNTRKKLKIKTAVFSMIFGILSFPFLWGFWVAFITVILSFILGTAGIVIGGGAGLIVLPLGLILGIVALVKAKRYPNEYGGKPLAITGIVSSSMGILLLPLIAAIAIPNLLAARKSANEGSAISSIKQMAEAQSRFMSVNRGRCGDLNDLGNAQVIDSVLAKGEKSGYRYMIVPVPSINGGCEITATPISTSYADRSFYYSTEDGIIRAAEKKGEIADKSDPPLDSDFPDPPQISSN